MKVERKTESKFEPITITIETEEEARIVWAHLNAPTNIINNHCHFKVSHKTSYELFCQYDEFFKQEW